jgi:hypothetical protein
MDPTLRRIIEERERDQDRAALGLNLSRVYCEQCTARLYALDEDPNQPTGRRLCPKCNKSQEEKVEVMSQPVAVTEVAKQFCIKGCGRELAPSSRTGQCSPCQQSVRNSFAALGKEPPPTANKGRKTQSPAAVATPPAAPVTAGELTTFEAVAAAAGRDPKQLLVELANDWVAKIRKAAEGAL